MPVVSGVRMARVAAGIYPHRPDLVLFELAEGSTWASMYTRNIFCAAPVQLAKQHEMAAAPRYLLVNAGNANAGTGSRGLRDAQTICAAVAKLAAVCEQQILPFSTGVIGEYLPVDNILKALPQLFSGMAADHWTQVAQTIMTTDTQAKGVQRQCGLASGETITINGIAKGSGMIRPDMATMLAFLFTDAAVVREPLQACLQQAVDRSFHCITVDGDTSTNDAVGLAATGQGATVTAADIPVFQSALNEVCSELAQAIVRDGEGATKLLTIDVEQGASDEECRQVAFTIAHSPLVKTAFFASDPNWGRLLAAIGRAGLESLDLSKITVLLGEISIVRKGERDPSYREEQGKAVMAKDEITVTVKLGRGDRRARVWTTDLSHEYIRINAEYRS